ncbi:hypothetical protein [Sphingobium fuliginis]|uniref:hypothetical protein n=1 Tax=Sphingobium fuliginis (strain ATCC 27551) TaxID=336203 RepID=UPI0004245ECB|nr:hypothetical protein [Sphingobium fuliginis]
MAVEMTRAGATIVLRLSNGPVNALSVGNGFVEELGAKVGEAASDPACRAIVIAGAAGCSVAAPTSAISTVIPSRSTGCGI